MRVWIAHCRRSHGFRTEQTLRWYVPLELIWALIVSKLSFGREFCLPTAKRGCHSTHGHVQLLMMCVIIKQCLLHELVNNQTMA